MLVQLVKETESSVFPPKRPLQAVLNIQLPSAVQKDMPVGWWSVQEGNDILQLTNFLPIYKGGVIIFSESSEIHFSAFFVLLFMSEWINVFLRCNFLFVTRKFN